MYHTTKHLLVRAIIYDGKQMVSDSKFSKSFCVHLNHFQYSYQLYWTHQNKYKEQNRNTRNKMSGSKGMVRTIIYDEKQMVSASKFSKLFCVHLNHFQYFYHLYWTHQNKYKEQNRNTRNKMSGPKGMVRTITYDKNRWSALQNSVNHFMITETIFSIIC